MTVSSSLTYHQSELLSNNSYRYFFLRQYFIDLLNISHSTLLQSMINTHQFIPKLEQIKTRRRRQLPSITPISTLHSNNCSVINNQQIQTVFHWSHSLESLSSIELIYHINSKQSLIPIKISIKQSENFFEVFSIHTNLKYDSIRNFYFINLYNFLVEIDKNNLIIEIIFTNQICETLNGYIIMSSLKSNSFQEKTKCKLKTIDINFEQLGLANLIIRPKEYVFTYCDDSCSNLISHQPSSIYTFFQSLIRKTHPNIPALKCSPSQYADDNFLLRQTDGSIEIYPVKNAIIKQCACL